MDKLNLSKDVLNEILENEKNCIDCKRCFSPCPMMKEYSSSPKELMKNIIDENKVDKNIPYSCMACDSCIKNCPKNIDLKKMFYDMRKDIYINNKKEIKSLGINTVKIHQANSSSSIFSKSFLNQNTKKIFFPGCSLSSYSSNVVIKTYEYLNEKIDNLGLVYGCCSKPTLDIGDKEKFKKYYSQIEELIKENNICEIIVACPNCYQTIKENSTNIKVKLIWEVIKENKIPLYLKDYYKDTLNQFSLHDPCSIRNENKIHDDVRDIIYQLGINIVEFDSNRENTQCCGAGGMVGVTSKDIANNQMIRRSNQTKADTIICYCESCCESMKLAGRQTIHVLDLLFNKDIINNKNFNQEKSGTINKWLTRYKGIYMAKNVKK